MNLRLSPVTRGCSIVHLIIIGLFCGGRIGLCHAQSLHPDDGRSKPLVRR